MDLKEEAALGNAINDHWYYVSKAHLLASHLQSSPARVLDVGAGAGWFSRWLLANGHACEATCVDLGYSHDWDEVVAERPLRFRRRVVETDANLVLMMDVLEHVDDDVDLLTEYMKMTVPGTHFFITVPAFQFLWSSHDEFLEHRRRYTLARLKEVVARAGATPLSSHTAALLM